MLVVARSDGPLTDADKAVATKLAETFAPNNDEKSPILSVMSYREDDVVGRKLLSRYDPKQGQAVLAILQLRDEFMAVDNMPSSSRSMPRSRTSGNSPVCPPGCNWALPVPLRSGPTCSGR